MEININSLFTSNVKFPIDIYIFNNKRNLGFRNKLFSIQNKTIDSINILKNMNYNNPIFMINDNDNKKYYIKNNNIIKNIVYTINLDNNIENVIVKTSYNQAIKIKVGNYNDEYKEYELYNYYKDNEIDVFLEYIGEINSIIPSTTTDDNISIAKKNELIDYLRESSLLDNIFQREYSVPFPKEYTYIEIYDLFSNILLKKQTRSEIEIDTTKNFNIIRDLEYKYSLVNRTYKSLAFDPTRPYTDYYNFSINKFNNFVRYNLNLVNLFKDIIIYEANLILIINGIEFKKTIYPNKNNCFIDITTEEFINFIDINNIDTSSIVLDKLEFMMNNVKLLSYPEQNNNLNKMLCNINIQQPTNNSINIISNISHPKLSIENFDNIKYIKNKYCFDISDYISNSTIDDNSNILACKLHVGDDKIKIINEQNIANILKNLFNIVSDNLIEFYEEDDTKIVIKNKLLLLTENLNIDLSGKDIEFDNCLLVSDNNDDGITYDIETFLNYDNNGFVNPLLESRKINFKNCIINNITINVQANYENCIIKNTYLNILNSDTILINNTINESVLQTINFTSLSSNIISNNIINIKLANYDGYREYINHIFKSINNTITYNNIQLFFNEKINLREYEIRDKETGEITKTHFLIDELELLNFMNNNYYYNNVSYCFQNIYVKKYINSAIIANNDFFLFLTSLIDDSTGNNYLIDYKDSLSDDEILFIQDEMQLNILNKLVDSYIENISVIQENVYEDSIPLYFMNCKKLNTSINNLVFFQTITQDILTIDIDIRSSGFLLYYNNSDVIYSLDLLKIIGYYNIIDIINLINIETSKHVMNESKLSTYEDIGINNKLKFNNFSYDNKYYTSNFFDINNNIVISNDCFITKHIPSAPISISKNYTLYFKDKYNLVIETNRIINCFDKTKITTYDGNNDITNIDMINFITEEMIIKNFYSNINNFKESILNNLRLNLNYVNIIENISEKINILLLQENKLNNSILSKLNTIYASEKIININFCNTMDNHNNIYNLSINLLPIDTNNTNLNIASMKHIINTKDHNVYANINRSKIYYKTNEVYSLDEDIESGDSHIPLEDIIKTHIDLIDFNILKNVVKFSIYHHSIDDFNMISLYIIDSDSLTEQCILGYDFSNNVFYNDKECKIGNDYNYFVEEHNKTYDEGNYKNISIVQEIKKFIASYKDEPNFLTKKFLIKIKYYDIFLDKIIEGNNTGEISLPDSTKFELKSNEDIFLQNIAGNEYVRIVPDDILDSMYEKYSDIFQNERLCKDKESFKANFDAIYSSRYVSNKILDKNTLDINAYENNEIFLENITKNINYARDVIRAFRKKFAQNNDRRQDLIDEIKRLETIKFVVNISLSVVSIALMAVNPGLGGAFFLALEFASIGLTITNFVKTVENVNALEDSEQSISAFDKAFDALNEFKINVSGLNITRRVVNSDKIINFTDWYDTMNSYYIFNNFINVNNRTDKFNIIHNIGINFNFNFYSNNEDNVYNFIDKVEKKAENCNSTILEIKKDDTDNFDIDFRIASCFLNCIDKNYYYRLYNLDYTEIDYQEIKFIKILDNNVFMNIIRDNTSLIYIKDLIKDDYYMLKVIGNEYNHIKDIYTIDYLIMFDIDAFNRNSYGIIVGITIQDYNMLNNDRKEQLLLINYLSYVVQTNGAKYYFSNYHKNYDRINFNLLSDSEYIDIKNHLLFANSVGINNLSDIGIDTDNPKFHNPYFDSLATVNGRFLKSFVINDNYIDRNNYNTYYDTYTNNNIITSYSEINKTLTILNKTMFYVDAEFNYHETEEIDMLFIKNNIIFYYDETNSNIVKIKLLKNNVDINSFDKSVLFLDENDTIIDCQMYNNNIIIKLLHNITNKKYYILIKEDNSHIIPDIDVHELYSYKDNKILCDGFADYQIIDNNFALFTYITQNYDSEPDDIDIIINGITLLNLSLYDFNTQTYSLLTVVPIDINNFDYTFNSSENTILLNNINFFIDITDTLECSFSINDSSSKNNQHCFIDLKLLILSKYKTGVINNNNIELLNFNIEPSYYKEIFLNNHNVKITYKTDNIIFDIANYNPSNPLNVYATNAVLDRGLYFFQDKICYLNLLPNVNKLFDILTLNYNNYIDKNNILSILHEERENENWFSFYKLNETDEDYSNLIKFITLIPKINTNKYEDELRYLYKNEYDIDEEENIFKSVFDRNKLAKIFYYKKKDIVVYTGRISTKGISFIGDYVAATFKYCRQISKSTIQTTKVVTSQNVILNPTIKKNLSMGKRINLMKNPPVKQITIVEKTYKHNKQIKPSFKQLRQEKTFSNLLKRKGYDKIFIEGSEINKKIYGKYAAKLDKFYLKNPNLDDISRISKKIKSSLSTLLIVAWAFYEATLGKELYEEVNKIDEENLIMTSSAVTFVSLLLTNINNISGTIHNNIKFVSIPDNSNYNEKLINLGLNVEYNNNGLFSSNSEIVNILDIKCFIDSMFVGIGDIDPDDDTSEFKFVGTILNINEVILDKLIEQNHDLFSNQIKIFNQNIANTIETNNNYNKNYIFDLNNIEMPINMDLTKLLTHKTYINNYTNIHRYITLPSVIIQLYTKINIELRTEEEKKYKIKLCSDKYYRENNIEQELLLHDNKYYNIYTDTELSNYLNKLDINNGSYLKGISDKRYEKMKEDDNIEPFHYNEILGSYETGIYDYNPTLNYLTVFSGLTIEKIFNRYFSKIIYEILYNDYVKDGRTFLIYIEDEVSYNYRYLRKFLSSRMIEYLDIIVLLNNKYDNLFCKFGSITNVNENIHNILHVEKNRYGDNYDYFKLIDKTLFSYDSESTTTIEFEEGFQNGNVDANELKLFEYDYENYRYIFDYDNIFNNINYNLTKLNEIYFFLQLYRSFNFTNYKYDKIFEIYKTTRENIKDLQNILEIINYSISVILKTHKIINPSNIDHASYLSELKDFIYNILSAGYIEYILDIIEIYILTVEKIDIENKLTITMDSIITRYNCSKAIRTYSNIRYLDRINYYIRSVYYRIETVYQYMFYHHNRTKDKYNYDSQSQHNYLSIWNKAKFYVMNSEYNIPDTVGGYLYSLIRPIIEYNDIVDLDIDFINLDSCSIGMYMWIDPSNCVLNNLNNNTNLMTRTSVENEYIENIQTYYDNLIETLYDISYSVSTNFSVKTESINDKIYTTYKNLISKGDNIIEDEIEYSNNEEILYIDKIIRNRPFELKNIKIDNLNRKSSNKKSNIEYLIKYQDVIINDISFQDKIYSVSDIDLFTCDKSKMNGLNISDTQYIYDYNQINAIHEINKEVSSDLPSVVEYTINNENFLIKNDENYTFELEELFNIENINYSINITNVEHYNNETLKFRINIILEDTTVMHMNIFPFWRLLFYVKDEDYIKFENYTFDLLNNIPDLKLNILINNGYKILNYNADKNEYFIDGNIVFKNNKDLNLSFILGSTYYYDLFSYKNILELDDININNNENFKYSLIQYSKLFENNIDIYNYLDNSISSSKNILDYKYNNINVTTVINLENYSTELNLDREYQYIYEDGFLVQSNIYNENSINYLRIPNDITQNNIMNLYIFKNIQKETYKEFIERMINKYINNNTTIEFYSNDINDKINYILDGNQEYNKIYTSLQYYTFAKNTYLRDSSEYLYAKKSRNKIDININFINTYNNLIKYKNEFIKEYYNGYVINVFKIFNTYISNNLKDSRYLENYSNIKIIHFNNINEYNEILFNSNIDPEFYFSKLYSLRIPFAYKETFEYNNINLYKIDNNQNFDLTRDKFYLSFDNDMKFCTYSIDKNKLNLFFNDKKYYCYLDKEYQITINPNINKYEYIIKLNSIKLIIYIDYNDNEYFIDKVIYYTTWLNNEHKCKLKIQDNDIIIPEKKIFETTYIEMNDIYSHKIISMGGYNKIDIRLYFSSYFGDDTIIGSRFNNIHYDEDNNYYLFKCHNFDKLSLNYNTIYNGYNIYTPYGVLNENILFHEVNLVKEYVNDNILDNVYSDEEITQYYNKRYPMVLNNKNFIINRINELLPDELDNINTELLFIALFQNLNISDYSNYTFYIINNLENLIDNNSFNIIRELKPKIPYFKLKKKWNKLGISINKHKLFLLRSFTQIFDSQTNLVYKDYFIGNYQWNKNNTETKDRIDLTLRGMMYNSIGLNRSGQRLPMELNDIKKENICIDKNELEPLYSGYYNKYNYISNNLTKYKFIIELIDVETLLRYNELGVSLEKILESQQYEDKAILIDALNKYYDGLLLNVENYKNNLITENNLLNYINSSLDKNNFDIQKNNLKTYIQNNSIFQLNQLFEENLTYTVHGISSQTITRMRENSNLENLRFDDVYNRYYLYLRDLDRNYKNIPINIYLFYIDEDNYLRTYLDNGYVFNFKGKLYTDSYIFRGLYESMYGETRKVKLIDLSKNEVDGEICYNMIFEEYKTTESYYGTLRLGNSGEEKTIGGKTENCYVFHKLEDIIEDKSNLNDIYDYIGYDHDTINKTIIDYDEIHFTDSLVLSDNSSEFDTYIEIIHKEVFDDIDEKYNIIRGEDYSIFINDTTFIKEYIRKFMSFDIKDILNALEKYNYNHEYINLQDSTNLDVFYLKYNNNEKPVIKIIKNIYNIKLKIYNYTKSEYTLLNPYKTNYDDNKYNNSYIYEKEFKNNINDYKEFSTNYQEYIFKLDSVNIDKGDELIIVIGNEEINLDDENIKTILQSNIDNNVNSNYLFTEYKVPLELKDDINNVLNTLVDLVEDKENNIDSIIDAIIDAKTISKLVPFDMKQEINSNYKKYVPTIINITDEDRIQQINNTMEFISDIGSPETVTYIADETQVDDTIMNEIENKFVIFDTQEQTSDRNSDEYMMNMNILNTNIKIYYKYTIDNKIDVINIVYTYDGLTHTINKNKDNNYIIPIDNEYEYELKSFGSNGGIIRRRQNMLIGGGDPYISLIDGTKYKLDNMPGYYRLFENEEIILNVELNYHSKNTLQRIFRRYKRQMKVKLLKSLKKEISKEVYYMKIYGTTKKGDIEFLFDYEKDNISCNTSIQHKKYIAPSSFNKSINAYCFEINIANTKLIFEKYNEEQIFSSIIIKPLQKNIKINGLMGDIYKINSMKLSNIFDTSNKKGIINKRPNTVVNEVWIEKPNKVKNIVAFQ